MEHDRLAWDTYADINSRRRVYQQAMRVEDFRSQLMDRYQPKQIPITAPSSHCKTIEPNHVCPPQRDEALDKTLWLHEHLRSESRERDALRRDLDFYGASGLGNNCIPANPPFSSCAKDALRSAEASLGRHYKRPWDFHSEIPYGVPYGTGFVPELMPERLPMFQDPSLSHERTHLTPQQSSSSPPRMKKGELSIPQQVQLRKIFNRLDPNATGAINRADMAAHLRECVLAVCSVLGKRQPDVKEYELENLFVEMESHASQSVGWHEFEAYCKRIAGANH